ncbi:MAG: hypothetical protein U0165_16500 [Polyangiaceae bacterium]
MSTADASSSASASTAGATTTDPITAPESPSLGASDPGVTEPRETDQDPDDAPPSGNAPRLVRGGVTFAIGAIASLLLMSLDRQLRLGVPLGVLFSLIATVGLLDLTGTFDDDHAPAAARVSLNELGSPLLLVALFGRAFLGALGLSVHGYFRDRVGGLRAALSHPLPRRCFDWAQRLR